MTRRISRIILSMFIAVTIIIGLCGTGIMTAQAGQYLPDGTNPAYAPAYKTLNEAKDAGNKLNEEIAAEAMILMKNEKDALPLAENERKVTLFGVRSVNMQTGGGGSSEGRPYNDIDLCGALEAEGFSVNPTVKGLYDTFYAGMSDDDKEKVVEMPVNDTNYSDAVKSSYSEYSDVAFIIVSRKGHEGSDMSVGDGSSKHEIEMSDDEIALFNHVVERREFGKVVLLVNTGNVFEISRYVDSNKVDAAVYIGYGGSRGICALPRILTGEVNPSGHTVDVWAANFRQDPTWFNFGTNVQAGGSTENGGTGPDGKPLLRNVRSLDYEEGVYVGYKWYETAAIMPGYFNAEDQYKDPANPDDPYYNRFNGVIYPFGYGLSYTSFSWDIGALSIDRELTAADAATEVSVPVTVTNTGDVAGKDLVQIYLRAPYDNVKGIEKSDVSLLAFQKTELLRPGDSETVTLKFNVRDLAAFDWNDINVNEFKGYELEPGKYELLFRTDSHTDKNAGESRALNVCADGVKYSEDGIDNPLNYNMGYGKETAKPWFSQENEYNVSRVGKIAEDGTRVNQGAEGDASYISRRAWRTPTTTVKGSAELALSKLSVDTLFSQIYYSAALDDPNDPYYKTAEDIPGYGQTDVLGGWKQAPSTAADSRKCPIQLKDMSGIPLDDPRWVDFMNQLTWKEMTMLVTQHNYASYGVASIGKPESKEADGPAQIRRGQASGTFFVSPTMIASTYNPELAYKQGRHIATESMLTSPRFTAWYAPGMNIHRSPFGGRNFEYYSQDGFHSGVMAAAAVKGATSNGLQVYIKHYAVNDMDTDRNTNGGITMWLTEQALREIYLKPFEYSVKYGDANGMMSTHGKIGLYATQNNNYLLNYVPCNEWGFDGNIITDLVDHAPVNDGRSAMTNGNMLVRCGNMFLGNPNHSTVEADRICDGRVIEGYYDDRANKVIVPESFTITNWEGTDNGGGVQRVYYLATTTPGAFTADSPTQWYWVRMTAMKFLYVSANTHIMGKVDGNTVMGNHVGIHYNDGVTPDKEYVVKEGTVIAPPENPVVADGKRFAGWYTDSGCTELADFTQPVKSAIHLYALIVDSNTFGVTFNLNYGGAPPSGMISVQKDSNVISPPFDPVRSGYTFAGWYLDRECKNKADLPKLIVSADMTLYAGWTEIAGYKVTFNLNYDGVRAHTVIELLSGGTVSEPDSAPKRNGYRFDGWYRDSRCTAKYDFTKPVEGDTELFAKWTQTEFVNADTVVLPEDGNIGLVVGMIVASAVAVAAIAFAVIALIKLKKKV